ncbi:hypothetical protein GQ457_10G004410 [Hibiscus cannabinus]
MNKPHLPCIGIDGFVQKLEYEGLNNICFGCGIYGHVKEICKNTVMEVARIEVEGSEFSEVGGGVWAWEEDRGRGSRFATLDVEESPMCEMVVIKNTHAGVEDPERITSSIGRSLVEGGSSSSMPKVVLNEAYLKSNPGKKNKARRVMASSMEVVPMVMDSYIGPAKAVVNNEWDLEGAGSSPFCRYFKSFVCQYRPKVVALFEPRVSGQKANNIVSRLGSPHSFRIEAHGFARGIWLFWEESIMVELLLMNVLLRIVVVKGPMQNLGYDCVGWRVTEDCLFTVKSTYSLRVHLVDHGADSQWKIIHHFRVRFKNDKLDEFMSMKFTTWVVKNITEPSYFAREAMDWDLMFEAVVWYIWKQRNALIFATDHEECLSVTEHICWLCDWSAKALATSNHQRHVQVDGLIGSIGIGSVVKAKLCAIYDGLLFAWNTGFRRVIVENDIQDAIRLVSCDKGMKRGLSIISHIAMLCDRDWEVAFSHVRRMGNRVADSLAKRGLVGTTNGELFIIPPGQIVSVLSEDGCQV